MIKAIDAQEDSSKNHEKVAPVYWQGVEKQLEAGILKETKKGRTYIKAKFKTNFADYCTEKLKEFGYKVVKAAEDQENTFVTISWGEDDLES